MLVAGFPCQSFSNAGRKLAFDDDRGQLFYELVRLATACRFRALLLENVRNLVATHGGRMDVASPLLLRRRQQVLFQMLQAAPICA